MSESGKTTVAPGALILALLVAGLLCRLGYVFLTPTFYAPDEQSHYNYVKHLAEKRSLPVLASKLGDASNEWEYSQPPGYYALLAPVYAAGRALGAEPVVVRLLRATSVGLWLLNVWLGLAFLRRLQISEPVTRVMVLGLVCLLPTYTFLSATINNDNLLITLGTAVLCLMTERQPSWKNSTALGLVLGLALLTKQSAVIFLPAITFLGMLAAVRRQMTWRAAICHLALSVGLATAMFLPWLLRNWRLYHTLTPEYTTTPLLTWPSLPYGVASAVHNLAKTFWSVSGMTNDIGYPFPLLGFGALLVWFVGHQQPAPAAGTTEGLNAKANGPLSAALLLAFGFNLLLVLRFGYLFGMGQGRHLFPLLLPVSLWLAAGWRKLPVPGLALWTTAFWILYALGFAMFSMSRFP